MSEDGLFEGVEKRIEILFEACIPFITSLRSLSNNDIDDMLSSAKCSILVKRSLSVFDSYVLSESSMFVYDHKIILLTCGLAPLLLAIPIIKQKASSLGLNIIGCQFTRGEYLFPEKQVYPHCSFEQECKYLNSNIEIMNHYHKNTLKWQMYQHKDDIMVPHKVVYFNISVKQGYIHDIKRILKIYTESYDDYIFTPCGYSINAYKGSGYITIHVTPQSCCSYVSIETYGIDDSYLFLKKLHDQLFEVFHS